MALAGTDTPSLLQTLEESFGHVDLDSTSLVSIDIPCQEPTGTEKPSDKSPESVSNVSTGESSLASAELVLSSQVLFSCNFWHP